MRLVSSRLSPFQRFSFFFNSSRLMHPTHAPAKLPLVTLRLARTFLVALACLCTWTLTAQAADPTVTTDKADYPPGSTVNISGSGFQAGETVELQVRRIDIDENSGTEHDPWDVTAEDNGNIQTTWHVTMDEAGATLELTAVGLTSGLVAQETFTDTATVTAATGGGSISADTTGGTYATLTGPVLTEGANRDIPSSGTIVFNAPAGFQFNTSSAVTASVTLNSGSGTIVTLNSTITVTTTTITTTITGRDGSSGSPTSKITWSGIQVRPTAGTLPASGIIYDSGTASIAGITTGSSGTSFGTLTEVAGAATQVAFGTQPSDTGHGGQTITPAVTASLADQFGNLTGSGSANITVAIGNNPASGTLGGTLTKAAISGTATFSDLSIDNVGSGYTLTASSTGLTGDTSSPFDILRIGQRGAATTANIASGTTLTINKPTGVVSGDVMIVNIQTSIL